MTSQINYTLIDVNFPRSGRDNNAQGFRNNFSATQNGLLVAKQELSNLQAPPTKVMTDENGDTAIDIIIDSSDYQTYSLIANTNFAARVSTGLVDHLFKTRVEITNPTSSSWILSFTGATYAKFDGLAYLDATNSATLNANETIVVDLWTTTSGNKIFLKVIGII